MELNERLLESTIMNELVRDKIPVKVFLTTGFQLQGTLVNWDRLVIVLVNDDGQQIIYKHSISSVTPLNPVKAVQPKK